MKDNFSSHSADYASYRPHYPPVMVNYILQFVNGRKAALDVATGNGQLAAMLAPHFKKVFATDISSNQLSNAIQKENITYLNEPAEKTAFADDQFDLITVAQAIHWFDFNRFYEEVLRTIKPGGVLAVPGYGLLHTNPASDKVIAHFYHDILGSYWDPERRHLDENYKTIPFPFKELYAEEQFSNRFTWTFGQLAGYLQTWSAVKHYICRNGTNPFTLIEAELKETWQNNDGTVVFPLLLRMGIPKPN